MSIFYRPIQKADDPRVKIRDVDAKRITAIFHKVFGELPLRLDKSHLERLWIIDAAMEQLSENRSVESIAKLIKDDKNEYVEVFAAADTD